MAYFAEIDENGIVLRVISISDADAPDPAPENSEPRGQKFIHDVLRLSGQWKQTSYNKNFRKNFAAIGGKYDHDADVFISPKPYESWILDENYDWQPPIPEPENPEQWTWDENSVMWVEI